jgi:peptide/nickel transport system permease protein
LAGQTTLTVGRYLAQRLISTVPTVLLATVAIFLLVRVVPGDIVLTILADTPHSVEMREALRDELGLNDPLPQQYARWLWNMLNGTFGGHSMETGEPISEMVRREAPATALISVYTLAVSLAAAFPLGLWAAMKPSRSVSATIRAITLAGLSLPNVLVASLVLLGLLRMFRWSPPIIYSTPGQDLGQHLQMVVWPVLILSWEFGSHLIRILQSTVSEVLQKEFVTAAVARGVPRLSIALRHTLRASGGPVLNVIGLQVGVLLGGTLVLESIFGIPGVGRGLVHAALARDLPVVQSYATIMVTLVLVVNLLVDVAHSAADPRTRSSQTAQP